MKAHQKPESMFWNSARLTDGKDATDAIVTPAEVQRCPPAPQGSMSPLSKKK